jgi:hypothetical protein
MLASACWPVSWHEIHVRVCCGLPKFIREPKVVADKKSDSDSININGYKLTPRAEIGVFTSVCEWVNLVIPVLFALWAYKDKGVERARIIARHFGTAATYPNIVLRCHLGKEL